MPTWVAALIAVGAITSTYFFCVRPARQGKCAMRGGSAEPGAVAESTGAQYAETDRQLAELREELRMLRAQDALDGGRVPYTGPVPPTAN